MQKILIAIMMFTCFCLAKVNPTHYFEGKWYHCLETYIVNPMLPKCSTTNGICADYDNKGNKIHRRFSNGYERWYEYETKGNTAHVRDSNGEEFWYEYDAKGKEIHMWDSDSNERWLKWFYDEKNYTAYQCDADEDGDPYFYD